MPSPIRTEAAEYLRIAVEALGRYRLRTALSVLGVVLGVAAVIAMLSVSEGAAREALAQVASLGLDNLVARTAPSATLRGLVAGDAGRVAPLVPGARLASPLVARYVPVAGPGSSQSAQVVGADPSFGAILGLRAARGRLLAPVDGTSASRATVLGDTLARQLFGYRDPVGQAVRLSGDYYQVVGVLGAQGADPASGGALAWIDINRAAFTPITTFTGRSPAMLVNQPVDELWLHFDDGAGIEDAARTLHHALARLHPADTFSIVVPRELLAQRYRTQRTFAVVVGSVAALALLVGGIGIMNIMLTSVVERTREIGVRRTAGATRRDITAQFLVETLLMTVSGGATGVALGAALSAGIARYAGWATHVSPSAVAMGLVVSLLVGLVFGWYPAVKAAALEPVDAMRFE